MNCPVDGTQLLMSDRQGIEVDYCPQCRGIWLDRGELDKLIERSAQMPSGGEQRQQFREERPASDQGYGREPERRKKRGSFLEDILDFG